MGMYTDLSFCAFVKVDNPEVVTILKEMCERPGEKDMNKLNALAPKHPFFMMDERTDWYDFFWNSQYDLLTRPPIITYEDYRGVYYRGVYKLSISISIKNYWDQIENFINWIKPYCTKFAGYTWYEEDKWPTWFKYDDYNDDDIVWQTVN